MLHMHDINYRWKRVIHGAIDGQHLHKTTYEKHMKTN